MMSFLNKIKDPINKELKIYMLKSNKKNLELKLKIKIHLVIALTLKIILNKT